MSDPFHKPLPGDSGLTAREPSARRRSRSAWWIVAGLVACVALAALRITLPAVAQWRLIRDIEVVGGTVGFAPRDASNSPWDRTIRPVLERLLGEHHVRAFDEVEAIWMMDAQIDDTWLRRLRIISGLTSLDLGGTRVTSEGMKEVARHKSLRILIIANTQVNDAGFSALRPLPCLTELYMDNCSVTDASLIELSRHTHLEWVSLRGTRITDTGVKHLVTLQSLKRLSLGETPVSERGYAVLSGSPSLRSLVVGGPSCTDATLEGVSRITTLVDLQVTDAPITDAGLAHLDRLSQLQTLILNRVQITNAGIETLRTLTALSGLDLWGTAMEGEALCDLLRALPALNWITVSRGQLSDACYEALQRDRPNLRISRHN